MKPAAWTIAKTLGTHLASKILGRRLSDSVERVAQRRPVISIVKYSVLACCIGPLHAQAPQGYGALVCHSITSGVKTDYGCDQNTFTQGESLSASDAPVAAAKHATEGAYDWLVAIGHRIEPGRLATFCAGSIVAARIVLTAAHCNVKPGDVVAVGRLDLATNAGREIQVVRVIAHPEFDERQITNDAALLYLSDNTNVVPIVVSHDRTFENNANVELRVAGWGTTSNLGPPSSILLENRLYVINLQGCKSIYKHVGLEVTDGMFCAEGKGRIRRLLPSGQVASDICQGDSGSGAVRWDPASGKFELVGLVSWGLGCGDAAYPGVYTRASAIAPWLDQQIHVQ